MLEYIDGELIEEIKSGKYNASAHVANCQNTMNSGVAKALRLAFEEVVIADKTTKRGDYNKMGNYTTAYLIEKIKDQDVFEIHNMYAQYDYGYDGKLYLNYSALDLCLAKISFNTLEIHGASKFVLPKIGSERSGGKWSLIERIIQKNLCKYHHVTVVNYNGKT